MKRDKEAGNRIRALRGNMTQADFAKSFGVTQSMISAWESERDPPSAENWIMLGELAGYPDCYWFYERAGLDRQKLLAATEKTLKDQIRDADSPLLEGQIVLVPRVRKSPQGLEPAGLPLPMPAVAIPNPLSTYCFILEGSLAGFEAVVDTAGASAGNLLPLWGQLVLMEFPPDVPDLWPEGLFIGTLYGPREQRMPGRIDWFADFLPLTGEMISCAPFIVGIWTERELEPSKPSSQVNVGPWATAEDFHKLFIEDAKKAFPRLEGETDEPWLARAMGSEKKRRLEELTSPKFMAKMTNILTAIPERVKRAASEIELGPGCKALGRAIAWFPSKVKEGK